MKIHSVHIRNFRKLKNCHIDFGEKETVFIGANNSGKTSAISAIVWFLKKQGEVYPEGVHSYQLGID